ncbi:hypothetical protein D9M68_435180 [compost metagenome]
MNNTQVHNANGLPTVHVRSSPGRDKESNWRPAPQEEPPHESTAQDTFGRYPVACRLRSAEPGRYARPTARGTHHHAVARGAAAPRVRRDHRPHGLCMGLADGEHAQPLRNHHQGAPSGIAWRSPARRAARPARHAARLHHPGRNLRHLPQPGCGLWPGLLLAGRRAGDRPGAGFRRPLLGVCPVRPAHRPVRRTGQALCQQARLLHAGGAELEGRETCWGRSHHPQSHRPGQCHPADIHGRHYRRPRGDPGKAQPGRRLPAEGFRREDEDHRLEEHPGHPEPECGQGQRG